MAPRQPGEQGYAGIHLDEENNSDMARIWNAQFQPGAGRGVRSSYVHLKGTLGQFCRLCVCIRVVKIRDLWTHGALFKLLLNKPVIRVFLSYFRIRGQPTTVSNKTANLKLAAKHACFHFSEEQDTVRAAKAKQMVIYLAAYRAAEQREITRTSRSTLEEKFSRGKMLEEKDVASFEKIAFEKCKGILRTAQGCPGGGAELFARPHVGDKMLKKWCLNMMVYLMFTGGGQRPQVFRMLLVPEEDEIAEWFAHRRNNDTISLRTPFEKTPRSQECPVVGFPRRAAALIRFHVREVRPWILTRNGIREGAEQRRTLLLNTRTGSELTAEEVRYGLQRFLTEQDPELKGITPMVVRSSFASVMFQKFKSGKCGESMQLKEFLTQLGRIMNTSPEMLMSNYVACNPLDQPAWLGVLHKSFMRESTEEDLQLLGQHT
jgi:hypothetical protein